MKCIVRKLKATIDNANLPVFENVVFKNYITTTEDDQYIYLDEVRYPFNNVRVEVLFEATVNNISFLNVVSTSPSNIIRRVNGYVRALNQQEGTVYAIPNNTEVRAGYFSNDGSFFVGSNTGVCGKPTTLTTVVAQCYVFATYNTRTGSKAGTIKIKEIKITDVVSGDVYKFVPAEINGVAVLYDADRGVYYGEANGGALVCG